MSVPTNWSWNAKQAGTSVGCSRPGMEPFWRASGSPRWDMCFIPIPRHLDHFSFLVSFETLLMPAVNRDVVTRETSSSP